MSSPLQPIFLFADSQLLFWKKQEILFLHSIRKLLASDSPRAAYIGAANGDLPEYYQIFESAMESIGVQNCRMIPATFPSEDRAFLMEADLILLAGGDVEKGWNTMQTTGMKELLRERYYSGAVLAGISAGAVQLGLNGWKTEGKGADCLIPTLGLVPFNIGAHEEKQHWETLCQVMAQTKGDTRGIGIPTGGGMVYHPGCPVTPIRHPLYEFSKTAEVLVESMLFPGADGLDPFGW